jgi:hypothetical protein
MRKKNEPKQSRYRTANLDPAEYEALEATAAEVAAELKLTKLSVPELIYRMHKEFKYQREVYGK